jgi:hypothetical protein
MLPAPDHTLVDQLLTDRCHRRRLDAQGRSNVTGLLRTGAEFRHGVKILLLEHCQPVKSNPKEVGIQVGDDAWRRTLDVSAQDRALGRGIPNVEAPFLDEVWVTLRTQKYLLDGVVLVLDVLVLRWLYKCLARGLRCKLSNFGIGEQALGVGLGVAGERGDLRKAKFIGINKNSVKPIKSMPFSGWIAAGWYNKVAHDRCDRMIGR